MSEGGGASLGPLPLRARALGFQNFGRLLHLLQVPAIAGSWTLATHPIGEALDELAVPAPDGFVADYHATLGQEHLDVAEAEREGVVEPL